MTEPQRKIGYFAPVFPGQTHLFLWRELQGLAELGVTCDIISTSRPPAGINSQDWANQVAGITTYLAPFSIEDGIGLVQELLAAGPSRWRRCADLILGDSDLSLSGRARLAALVLPATKLARHARQAGVDHVHVQSCADAANIAMLASVISDLGYSLSLLGPTLESYGPNQRNKWRHARFCVVMSQLLLRAVQERLDGALPARVEVLPVGVDLDVVKRDEPYEPWRGKGECRIYSCGRLNAVKGHKDLVDAVALVRERGVPAILHIAGEDEQGGTGYRKELERHIATRHAEGFVRLLGAIGENVHKAQLARAHVFALASLNEGISVAIMEAMAMQTPVVVTRVGGNDEMLEHRKNGILTPPEQPAVFAEALHEVVSTPALALQLSAASRARIAEKFDSHGMAAKLVQCLEQCVWRADR